MFPGESNILPGLKETGTNQKIEHQKLTSGRKAILPDIPQKHLILNMT